MPSDEISCHVVAAPNMAYHVAGTPGDWVLSSQPQPERVNSPRDEAYRFEISCRLDQLELSNCH